jgi:RHS repeat-associated protein
MKSQYYSFQLKFAMLIFFSLIGLRAYSDCHITINSPVSTISFTSDGGSYEFGVYTDPNGCTSLTYSLPDWISIDFDSEHETSLIVLCQPNNSTESRTGTIDINGQYSIGVVQDGTTSPLNGGTISLSGSTICYNTAPGTINNSLSPSGGSCTGYTYWWESSVTTGSSGFSSIAGASSLTYSPGPLTSTTYFRRGVSCNGTTEYSNVVTITVYSILSSGSIGSAQTICYGASPSSLTQLSVPTGGTGTYTYQWQSSTDNSTWTSISGATSSTYSPGALTANKYFRRNVTSGSCSTVSSSSVLITVPGTLTAGTIGTAQTICYSSTPATLTQLTAPSGGIGTYTYQWQSSSDNSTWTSITGATSSTYSPGALTANTYYRRSVTSGSCGTVNSTSILITVYANLIAGTIGTAQTICYGSTPATLAQLTAPSGGTGTYTYQWQSSSDNSTWTSISGATSSTYSPAALTANTYFRRNVTSGLCATVSGNSILITVYGNLTAGSIGTSQSICYMTTPSPFTQITAPTGGTGTYTYQWQISSNNSYWVDIPGATLSTYTPGTHSASRYYRRNVTSGTCGTISSSSILITVYANLTAGTIGTAQTICYGSAPATLTQLTAPSGGTGTYTYQWQSSTDNSTWTSISGATSSTYSPSALTANTYFRRTVTSGSCGTASGSSILITVYSSLTAGTIGTAQTICYGSAPATLTQLTAPSGGTGTYTYQWQSSTDNSSWTSISGATSSTYSPGALTANKYFMRNVTSGSCGTVSSSSILISLYPTLTAGSIQGIQSICKNAVPASLTQLSAPTGGSGTYTFQWQSSVDNSTWSNISGATSAGYSPGALAVSTYFRRNVTSCSTASSSSVLVSIYPDLSGGTIGSDQLVSYGLAPDLLTNVSAPSAGGGSYTYSWYKSTDNGISWSIISGANQETYQPDALYAVTKFKRVATDICGTQVASNFVKVTVSAIPALTKTKNFIYTSVPNVMVSDQDSLAWLPIDEINQSVIYYDGLGRPMQNSLIYASPNNNDIVTPIVYDECGREKIKYLAYPTSILNFGKYIANDTVDQKSWYQATYFDTKSYSKTVFDNSPLNRVMEQGAPGLAWQPESGHPVRYEYGSNGSDVRLFKVNSDNSLSVNGYYTSKKLYKTVVKDENWDSGNLHTTEEFKDIPGNVVLKRTYVGNASAPTKVETYYVYDNLGLLRYVLSPEAINNLGSSTSLTCSSDLIKKWCYYYEYDAKKRMTIKQLPGADQLFMVYDDRDRLVATQDGNLRTNTSGTDLKKWLFTKYDCLNRPVLTGIVQIDSVLSQSGMQKRINRLYSGTAKRAYFVTCGTVNNASLGYNDASYPISSDGTIQYLTATYYDNYNYPGVKNFDSTLVISDYRDVNGHKACFTATGSKVTGMKVLVLDGGTSYLTSTSYYDDNYRIIEVRRDLYDSINGLETSSNKYDFIGKVLQSQVNQTFGSATTKVNKYFEYDHTGRLTKTEQQIGDNIADRVILSEMGYYELGVMKQKDLNVVNTTSSQTINYFYNIRGWLTGINNPDELGNDYFAMKLYYNTVIGSPLTSSAQYNGNISGMKWISGMQSASPSVKGYGFTYDALNRLTSSDYGEGSGYTVNPDYYNEEVSLYDLNGNIKSLSRAGVENSINYPTMDVLTYTYSGNKLIGVEDGGNKTYGFADGHTYSPSSYDYDFDSDGNLIKDLNKSITSISYNYLNLPSKVTKDVSNNVSYVYDAMGTKLKKISVLGGSRAVNRYYNGTFEYDKSKALVLLHTDEGVVNVSHTNGTVYSYEYHLKDHLGNIRVAFTPGAASLAQVNEYYPFGMLSSTNSSATNKYLYNGKELQDELEMDWYDYGARFYDPQIGRFPSIDPIANKFPELTTYQYASNNPVRCIDIDGLEGKPVNNLNQAAADQTRVSIPNRSLLPLRNAPTTGNDKVWGTMTIHTNVGPNAGMTAGHAWVEFKGNNGSCKTLSLWGNQGNREFFADKELGSNGVVSRTVSITNDDVNKINQFNSDPKNVDWKANNTCAGYSANLWNTVTGENLNATDAIGATTPATLSGSIIDANGGNTNNGTTTTTGQQQDGNNTNAGTSTPSSSSSSSGSSNNSSLSQASSGGGGQKTQQDLEKNTDTVLH